jgi:hypothetical protein
MSILVNESHANPTTPLWKPSPCGIYNVVAGTTQTISIQGLTSSSIVGLTYIHPTGGGGNQWFVSSTPSTNTLTIVLGTAGAVGETIIWSVLKF